MAFCRVSYRDIEKIEHTVELDADTLFEAVAAAVHRFRTEERWAGVVPGPGSEFMSRCNRIGRASNKIALSAVEQFARNGTAKGPQGYSAQRAHPRIARDLIRDRCACTY